MILYKKNILYIYFNARKERIGKNELSPAEFFYGYEYFRNQKNNVSVLEFDGNRIKYLTKFLAFLQKIIIKLFKFQYEFSGMFRAGKFHKIISNDVVIATNNRIAHSILPALIYMKFKKINCKTYVIAMGMLNFPKNIFQKKIHILLNKFLLLFVENLIFIGKKEYDMALNIFYKQKYKIKFLPFGVDKEYWSSNNIEKNKSAPILFIGNDSNRDFDFIVKLAKETPEENFLIISDYFEENYFDQFDLKNVEFYKGSWNKQFLTDEFLKSMYEKAKLTIVPLKNSIQPSGQSVSLQSMSMNTPVIITKTEGFWDSKYFVHKKNIYFVEKNTILDWQNAISELINDENMYNSIIANARKIIEEEFNVQNFSKKLYELTNIE